MASANHNQPFSNKQPFNKQSSVVSKLAGFAVDHWQFLPEEKKLTSKETQVTLKPLLTKLLLHFVSSPYKTFSVDELKAQVWKQTFLTDSAVKKAISELRQQLRNVAGSDKEYIKNEPGKGYRFNAQPSLTKQTSPITSRINLLISTIISVLIAVVWIGFVDVSEMESEETPQLTEEALTLYLQGKSLYYKQGDAKLVEQRFFDSIALHQKANPSYGALLDLWGLQLRSLKHGQRPPHLQTKVAKLIEQLQGDPTFLSADNLVALAKFYIVNEGNAEKAIHLFQDSKHNFDKVYDPHIRAFSMAVHGHKATDYQEKSQQIMAQAEQRFPERNVILWYKAFVSLINGELENAMNEAGWAQKIAPDWYPLVFIASHLLNQNEALAWQHLIMFPPEFIGKDISHFAGFKELLQEISTIENEADYQPFEVEILYLLGIHFGHREMQQSGQSWVAKHYPEKLLMLTIIDNLYQYND